MERGSPYLLEKQGNILKVATTIFWMCVLQPSTLRYCFLPLVEFGYFSSCKCGDTCGIANSYHWVKQSALYFESLHWKLFSLRALLHHVLPSCTNLLVVLKHDNYFIICRLRWRVQSGFPCTMWTRMLTPQLYTRKFKIWQWVCGNSTFCETFLGSAVGWL